MSVIPFDNSDRLPVKIPKGPWQVIPCKTRDKAPLTAHGVKDATADRDQIRKWWTRWPNAMIGAAMGEPCGLWCLDVDPRNGGAQSLEVLQDETGPWPATWHVRTGGGGDHFYFRLPEGVKVPNSKPMPGIDILSTGKYAILPPSVHPSGTTYSWFFEESPDDLDGPAFAPQALLDFIEARTVQAGSIEEKQQVISGGAILPDARITEIRSALSLISSDEYDIWLRVGMAWHHEAPTEQGYAEWASWSQGSDKFDDRAQRKTWIAFKRSTDPSPVTMDTVFRMAIDAGWPGAPTVEIDLREDEAPEVPDGVDPETGEITAPVSGVPSALLQIPGVLQELVNYDLRTAPRPNAQLAIQGALAFGSAVLARRYVTDRANHPSLFFLSVSKSGTGKEHARKIIQRALADCKLPSRIGGSGYASGSAVFSALEAAPAHVGLIDELGRVMATTDKSRNEHRMSAITALMEVYGRADGVMTPMQYSTRGLTQQQRQELAQQVVQCPNLSILAITTPDTFYDSINESAVRDGFLPRFLIVESDAQRAPIQAFTREDTPQVILDWAQGAADRVHGDDLVSRTNETLAEIRPNLVTVPISNAARREFQQMELRIIARQDHLEREGLAEILNRTVENAMRLSLIVALSRNIEAPSIDLHSASWAIAYCEYYAEQGVKAFQDRVTTSEFGAWQAEARRHIKSSDDKGLTARDFRHRSRTLRDLPTRQFNEVMQALVDGGACVLASIKSKRGPSRKAWVRPELTEKQGETAQK